MSLCNRWRMAWLALGAATMALSGACGSGGSDPTTSNTTQHGGQAGDAGQAGAGGQAGSGGWGGSGGAESCLEPVVLAMDRLWLGDTDPDLTPNTMAWKGYGLDVDHRVTTDTYTDLCRPIAGTSPNKPHGDGVAGIDNSFGKNVLPLLLGFASGLTAKTQERLQNGEFTYLVTLGGTSAAMECTPSTFLGGRGLGTTPKLDGSDLWPIASESLMNPEDPLSARNVFLDAVIEKNAYRSGLGADFTLEIAVNSAVMRIPIRHARLEMKLEPNQMGALEGQLGGVVETEAMAEAVRQILAQSDPFFCEPSFPTVQAILDQVRQASDILDDGSQDPTKDCNAISIGVGFTMKSAQLGATALEPPPVMDPCMP